MLRVRVLQAQLVPVAKSPGQIRRIGESFVVMVRGALHVIEQKPAAPLAVPFIREVGIDAPGADTAFVLISTECAAGKAAIRVEEITAVAVKQFGAAIPSLELVILKRDVAHFEIEPGD